MPCCPARTVKPASLRFSSLAISSGRRRGDRAGLLRSKKLQGQARRANGTKRQTFLSRLTFSARSKRNRAAALGIFKPKQPFRISLVVAGTSLAGGYNMSRLTLLVTTLVLLGSVPAGAQSPPAQSGPGNNAVNSSDHNNSNAPVAGRNSFTEGQAKSRLEAAGYSNVSGLQKDNEGVWRGKADKAGTKTNVTVDFQGNINPAK
jgi:hypothetical protein